MHGRKRLSSCGAALLMLLLLPLIFSGCSKVGTTVPEDERVAFERTGKTGEGVYDEGILQVAYRYRLTGSTLDIAGYVDLTLPWESLDVYALFIDSRGEVLEQKNIYSSSNVISLVNNRNSSFHATLEMPQAAAGISFSYSYMPYRGHR